MPQAARRPSEDSVFASTASSAFPFSPAGNPAQHQEGEENGSERRQEEYLQPRKKERKLFAIDDKIGGV
jgi:hypothetical protein